jgi:hypothetical protein
LVNNVNLLITIGILGAVVVFWRPTICEALNNITNGQFDMCTFQSTGDGGGDTHDHSAPSPEPGVLTGGRHPHVRHRTTVTDTTVSSPEHKKHVAKHHQASHGGSAHKAAHEALAKKHAAPGGHPLAHLTQAQKCAADICKTHQCLNCPPPTSKASLAYVSGFRMSGW